uniref:SLC13 family permease n=1 Tax=Ningiella ruwaisensis TaxID=2364274 RepID=UPI0010A019EB|nr:SLC13 family permease [Ningiella ruwaisensis]
MPLNKIMFLLGPIIAISVYVLLLSAGFGNFAAIAGAVTTLCAIWWIFETIPIAATALIPIAVFPFTGVLSAGQVASAYGSPIVLLMLAGFMLSIAMEKSGTHRRLALGMLNATGTHHPWRLIFGFALVSASLSMWISNTATALMLLPIALATLESNHNKRLAIAVMLAIAYGASVGGLATPIGTPTNLVFMQVYSQTTGADISFTQWMSIALPVTLLMLPIIVFILSRGLSKVGDLNLPDMGQWRTEEKRMLIVFACVAVAWITRSEPFDGWSAWFGLPANDASVGLIGVLAMFLISDGKGGKLLDWENAERIPWGILILFGSGISIATAFTETGLSDAIGAQLAEAVNMPLIITIALICLIVTFLTEVTSNTATAVLLMPILAATALATSIDPALLMIPAVLSCSCAFMLPVATPPNAVAYSSRLFSINQMARIGILLNLIGVVVITSVIFLRLG